MKKKKRKLKTWVKGTFIIFLIAILAGSSYLIYDNVFKGNNDSTKVEENNDQKEPVVEEVKEEVYELSMVMVGDALIHDGVYHDARNYGNGTYDFTGQIELIKPIIKEYDLAFYNQETILGGVELGLSGYPRFNSPYEVGDAFIDAGFNMVSLATNHTMDKNEQGVLNSCAYWEKQEGVVTAGSYCSKEDRDEVKVYEKNGITYGFLAYTYGTNGIPVPSGKEYLVNVYSNELAKSDIEKVRDKVDVLFVSMHWGIEYTNKPVQSQIDQANYLASLGVDVIIGHHPHVVEPITWIDDTLVIYSLGNFISAQANDLDYNKLVGLMTSIDITKTVKGEEVEIVIDNINNELLYTYYSLPSWRNYKVVPFSQMTTNYNYDYKRLYEKYSAVIKMYDETLPVNAILE